MLTYKFIHNEEDGQRESIDQRAENTVTDNHLQNLPITSPTPQEPRDRAVDTVKAFACYTNEETLQADIRTQCFPLILKYVNFMQFELRLEVSGKCGHHGPDRLGTKSKNPQVVHVDIMVFVTWSASIELRCTSTVIE
jgi:hypothetical protein